ncbi:MAG TPA: amidohydrolase family protein [Vicinamibacterales bacterium]|jgi:predicted TIM-barrel fold metal-dependent hydrolase|nr:amidohydrolase family protein [Vicinamibacterales bacterium]
MNHHPFRRVAPASIGLVALVAVSALHAQYSHKPGPHGPPVMSRTAPADRPKYDIVDGHFHLLNFVQETDGIEAFLKAMDDTGVSESVITGMPLVKKWEQWEAERPTYYLEDDSRAYWYSATDFMLAQMLMKLKPEQRRRLHPFICGINSSDKNAVDHVERMLAAYPGLWKGIGEVFARHDDLTALTLGDVSRANMQSFDRLIELAQKNDMPILIHSDIGPAWLEKPNFLSEVEHAVRTHPKAKIIWAHAGISRRIVIPNHTEILAKMLKQYPNLRVDISWVIFEQEIAPNNVLDKRWPALIEQFPDRFIIGSDVVGTFGLYKPTIQRYYLVLDALKPDTARKLARTNFLAALPSASRPGSR